MVHYCAQHSACHVLEINVDAIWASVGKLVFEVVGTMVEAGIEAEFVCHEPAFFSTTGNADRTTPFDLCNLADDTAYSARRCGDHQSLARFG